MSSADRVAERRPEQTGARAARSCGARLACGSTTLHARDPQQPHQLILGHLLQPTPCRQEDIGDDIIDRGGRRPAIHERGDAFAMRPIQRLEPSPRTHFNTRSPAQAPGLQGGPKILQGRGDGARPKATDCRRRVIDGSNIQGHRAPRLRAHVRRRDASPRRPPAAHGCRSMSETISDVAPPVDLNGDRVSQGKDDRTAPALPASGRCPGGLVSLATVDTCFVVVAVLRVASGGTAQIVPNEESDVAPGGVRRLPQSVEAAPVRAPGGRSSSSIPGALSTRARVTPLPVVVGVLGFGRRCFDLRGQYFRWSRGRSLGSGSCAGRCAGSCGAISAPFSPSICTSNSCRVDGAAVKRRDRLSVQARTRRASACRGCAQASRLLARVRRWRSFAFS